MIMYAHTRFRLHSCYECEDIYFTQTYLRISIHMNSEHLNVFTTMATHTRKKPASFFVSILSPCHKHGG